VKNPVIFVGDTGSLKCQILLANSWENLRLFIAFLCFGVMLQASENVVGIGAGSVVFDSTVDGAVDGFPCSNSAFQFGYFSKACLAQKVGCFGGFCVGSAVDVDVADWF